MKIELNPVIKEILEWILCIIIALILALVIRYYIGTPTVVQQTSMYPTLKQDQRLWLNRLGKTFNKMPKRGDIITFEAPTVKFVLEDQIDLDNPVAIYENEPETLIRKFTYNVLEVEKISFIKRVIALPGEYVEIKDGLVYVNKKDGKGLQPLDESAYLQEGVVTEMGTGLYTGFTVPENCVFAMGDNRGHSTDCRNFGCVPLEKIGGTAVFRFWPLNVIGGI